MPDAVVEEDLEHLPPGVAVTLTALLLAFLPPLSVALLIVPCTMTLQLLSVVEVLGVLLDVVDELVEDDEPVVLVLDEVLERVVLVVEELELVVVVVDTVVEVGAAVVVVVVLVVADAKIMPDLTGSASAI